MRFFFFFFFSFTLLHRLDAKPALIKSVFFSVVQKHKYGSPSLKQQEPLCTFRHENGRSNESANDKETKRKMKPSPALTHLSSSATKNEGKKSNCFFFFGVLMFRITNKKKKERQNLLVYRYKHIYFCVYCFYVVERKI